MFNATHWELVPYQGRALDHSHPVEVYRNLNRGGYSIRQFGLVVAHCTRAMLVNARFVVNQAGHRRMMQQGKRNVHAWVWGFVADNAFGGLTAKDDLAKIRYDKDTGRFVWGVPYNRLKGADCVVLNERGASAAYTW